MDYILKEFDDGHRITVRDVQLAIIPIVEEIDRICKKHNIEYILAGGSALGAIRHKGFIPWDDDFDICMMKDQYDKFLKVLPDEMSEDFYFQCFKTHKKYNVLIPAMKIRKKNTYLKEVNTLLANKCEDGDGLFVDVFILDHCSKNKLIDLPFRLFNILLMPLIILFENININPYLLKKIFVKNAELYGKLNKNSKYIGYDLTWTFKNPLKPYIYLESDLFPSIRVPFENILLPVAHNYDIYLQTEIGKTYMQFPKLEDQKPKHIVDIDLGE